MNEILLKLLNSPKKTVPIFALVALILGALAYPHVGVAPAIPQTLLGNSTTSRTATSSSDLAFQVAGKVAQVYVKTGDKVTVGQTLAALDSSAALGALNQAKGALDLAKAQLASQNVQYANTKKDQDVIVANAYATLLSSSLEAKSIGTFDESHNPTITGTYTCTDEGSYQINTYASNVAGSGYSFTYSGLESGTGAVKYNTPQPLGSCGLFITFVQGFSGSSMWEVDIPNDSASNYQANKNAYDLAVANREQSLNQLAANIGLNGSEATNVAGASVTAAEGGYESALANYRNFVITAPIDGTISYVDPSLKAGQLIFAGKVVISIHTNDTNAAAGSVSDQ